MLQISWRGALWRRFRFLRQRRREPARPVSFRPWAEVLEGRLAPATFFVRNTNDSGPDSLRQVITDANSTPGLNTIDFNIDGSGVQTISLVSALPVITNPAIIDGTSQPGFSGTPLIVLDGTSAGAGVNGLTITAGNSTVEDLVIDNFAGAGIALQAGGGNVIAGNYIGVDSTGAAVAGNGASGIAISGGSSNNTIGGTTATARNIISGNTVNGVDISGAACANNLIQGNYIGTDVSGSLAVGNAQYGVSLNSASVNNIVSNTISGNGSDGVNINGDGLLAGGVSWWKAEANANDSVGSNNGTLFGGVTFVPGVAGQAFAFNGTDAHVRIPHNANLNPGASFSVDFWEKANPSQPENRFDIVNKSHGFVDSTGWAFQGTPTGALNFVLGRGGSSTDNFAEASTGVSILDNQWHYVAGVYTGSSIQIYLDGALKDTVSFPDPPANNTRDLFFGTAVNGDSFSRRYNGSLDEVAIYNRALSTSEIQKIYSLNGVSKGGATIQGNNIGSDAGGSYALGNGGNGITINGASGNTIGGTITAAHNVISANTANGVNIARGASANLVQGNFIGTDSNGAAALGNCANGVVITSASNNTIGGTATGTANIIANSGNDGVLVDTGTGNAIRGNSIFSSTNLGIELINNGNNNQAAPVLASAVATATTITIQGTFAGAANSSYTLEFFANSTANPSGFGEGSQLLGSATVATDASGTATFTLTFTVMVTPGQVVSATATDPARNTSEFAQDVMVAPG
jgi:titin